MPRAEQYVVPATDVVLVSVAAPTSGGPFALPEGTRGLLVGTAGALTVEINGQTRTAVPFTQGSNPGFFTAVVVDAGNTAANIWAIL